MNTLRPSLGCTRSGWPGSSPPTRRPACPARRPGTATTWTRPWCTCVRPTDRSRPARPAQLAPITGCWPPRRPSRRKWRRERHSRLRPRPSLAGRRRLRGGDGGSLGWRLDGAVPAPHHAQRFAQLRPRPRPIGHLGDTRRATARCDRGRSGSAAVHVHVRDESPRHGVLRTELAGRTRLPANSTSAPRRSTTPKGASPNSSCPKART